MGENVVFNNSQDPPNQQPIPDAAQVAPETATSVDQAATPAEETTDPNTAADQPVEEVVTDETATDGVTDGEEIPPDEPPPPSGPLAILLGGSLLKKVLIGVGAFVFLMFIIFLLLPKPKKVIHVTITWWNLWESPNVVQPIVNDFEKLHPDITVNYVKQDPNNYSQLVLTRIQNGVGPDIFVYHNTWLPIFSSVLLPLPQTVLTPSQFQQTFYPVMQQDIVQNGAIYGIPLGVDSLALMVNTDIFRDAGVNVPRTWDEFAKAAIKLTVKDQDGKIKTAGAALGTYNNVTHAQDILALLFAQQGATMKTFTTDTQDETDAFDFYTSFTKGDQPVWDSTLDQSKLAFAKGSLAMYIGYSWDIFDMQRLNPDMHFAVYPAPSLFDKNTTISSYWVQGVSARSKNQQAALQFMKYLLQKDTTQKMYTAEAQERGFGEPYARKDLADTLKDNAMVYPFVSQLPYASSSLFVSNTFDGDGGLNSSVNIYLQNAVNDSVNNHTSTPTVIGTVQQGVSQVFQKYGIQ